MPITTTVTAMTGTVINSTTGAIVPTPAPTTAVTTTLTPTATLTAAPSFTGTISALSAVSGGDVWAVGAAPNGQPLIRRWDDHSWHAITAPGAPAGSNLRYQLTGIDSPSARDAWAVGARRAGRRAEPLIEHWNGRYWRVVPSVAPAGKTGYYLRGVVAFSRGDAWAVGNAVGGVKTLIEHWNGHRWRVIASPSPGAANLQAVAAVSGRDVWAVGGTTVRSHERTLIEQWNGRRWRVVKSQSAGGASERLLAVAAVSARDVWAVGDQTAAGVVTPLIDHWNGRSWRIVHGPAIYGSLSAVMAVSSRDVWAAGGPLVQHWDGRRWRIVPNPNGGSLVAAAVVAPHDVWVAANTRGAPEVDAYTGTACAVAAPSIRSVRIAASPVAMALDATHGTAFVASRHGVITVIDVARQRAIRTIDLHLGVDTVQAMAIDARHEWLAVSTSQRLFILDARSGAILHALGVGGSRVVTTAAGTVIMSGATRLIVVDGATGRVLNAVPLPHALAVPDDATNRVFAVGDAGTVVLDAASGQVLQTLRGLSGALVAGLRSAYVYVAPRDGSAMSVLDATSGAIVGTVEFGAGARIGTPALDVAAGRVFVPGALNGVRHLYMLDAADDSLLATATLPTYFPGAAADGIAATLVDEANGRVFTISRAGYVTVFDAATGAPLHAVDLGCDVATAPALQPMLDSGADRLIVVCARHHDRDGAPLPGQSIVVLDAATGTILSSVPAADPIALAVDNRANRALVVDAGTPRSGSGSVRAFDVASGAAR